MPMLREVEGFLGLAPPLWAPTRKPGEPILYATKCRGSHRQCGRTADKTLCILRRHSLEKVPVSDLCDQFQLRPTVFYRWQKRFFENGMAALEDRDDSRVRGLERENADLREQLVRKNQVVAEVVEAYIALRQVLGRSEPFGPCPMPQRTPACRRQASLLFSKGTCPVHAEPVQSRPASTRTASPSGASAGPATRSS